MTFSVSPMLKNEDFADVLNSRENRTLRRKRPRSDHQVAYSGGYYRTQPSSPSESSEGLGKQAGLPVRESAKRSDPCSCLAERPARSRRRALCLTDFQNRQAAPNSKRVRHPSLVTGIPASKHCVTARGRTATVENFLPRTTSAQDHHDCGTAHEEKVLGG
jgi:hypothetical protein